MYDSSQSAAAGAVSSEGASWDVGVGQEPAARATVQPYANAVASAACCTAFPSAVPTTHKMFPVLVTAHEQQDLKHCHECRDDQVWVLFHITDLKMRWNSHESKFPSMMSSYGTRVLRLWNTIKEKAQWKQAHCCINGDDVNIQNHELWY